MSNKQDFDTTDWLRLEIEETASGLTNLVQNPSGELGGWAWVTPISGSKLEGGTQLTYTGTSASANAEYFYTEAMPITATHYAAASWYAVGGSTGDYYRVKFEWLDASKALLSSSTQTGYLSVSATGVNFYGPYQAPASTAYFRIRFDLYDNNTGTNPGASNTFSIQQVTAAKHSASASLGTLLTNLVKNPSFETNTSGWVADTGCSIARTTSQSSSGSAALAVTATSGMVGTYFRSASGTGGMPVSPGKTYTLQFKVKAATVARSTQISVAWYKSSGAGIITHFGSNAADNTSGWTTITKQYTAPSNAAYAAVYLGNIGCANGEVHYFDAVMFEVGTVANTYFDGSIADGGGYDYAWSGTAHASASTATTSNLLFIEPIAYRNILGPTHELKLTQEELNVGSLTATILDADIEPAVSDLIRPGKKVRLMVQSEAEPGVWRAMFSGKAATASVTYDLKDPEVPESKRARIELVAVDAFAELANQARPQGVGTVAELPYVLEGCGVPWYCEGPGGNQVASATIVSTNDNASALDQVAITRDSVNGVVWVDGNGVLTVFDSDYVNGAGSVYPDEYSDIDISYNTDDCINEVIVKYLRYNASTLETEEIVYGPYRDETSIAEWGVRSAEFTVHGISEASISTFASAVLTANATPSIQANSVTIPVKEDWQPFYYGIALGSGPMAGVNVYDPNDDWLGFFYAHSVEHTITPEKWMVTYNFRGDNTVAPPTMAPPVQTGEAYDTGWVNHTPGNGGAPFAGGSNVFFQYRRIGKIVHVRFNRTTNASYTPSAADGNFTNVTMTGNALPAEIRPAQNTMIVTRFDDVPWGTLVASSGHVILVGGNPGGRTFASGSVLDGYGSWMLG